MAGACPASAAHARRLDNLYASSLSSCLLSRLSLLTPLGAVGDLDLSYPRTSQPNSSQRLCLEQIQSTSLPLATPRRSQDAERPRHRSNPHGQAYVECLILLRHFTFHSPLSHTPLPFSFPRLFAAPLARPGVSPLNLAAVARRALNLTDNAFALPQPTLLSMRLPATLASARYGSSSSSCW